MDRWKILAKKLDKPAIPTSHMNTVVVNEHTFSEAIKNGSVRYYEADDCFIFNMVYKVVLNRKVGGSLKNFPTR